MLFFHKTYGFIRSEKHKDDIFFHYTSIETEDVFKKLENGDDVTFDLIETNGKIEAVNIVKCQKTYNNKAIVNVRLINLSNIKRTDVLYCNMTNAIFDGLRFAYTRSESILLSNAEIDEQVVNEIITRSVESSIFEISDLAFKFI